jgi:uncharacterized lipoprotein (TIGR02269 family)
MRTLTRTRVWLLWFGLMAACATSGPVMHEDYESPDVVASWEEGCEDVRALLPLCDENGEECGLYRCREVVPREALLACRGGGPLYIPMGPSFPQRWWGRPVWLPRDTQPVLTFQFYRRPAPQPPLLLPRGRWVHHHIFPQAAELQEWFHQQGIPNIHHYTIVIPEQVHIRIHGGGPKGGRWNEAWRQFINKNPNAQPAEIYRHAGELIFQFELTGGIVPYYKGVGR